MGNNGIDQLENSLKKAFSTLNSKFLYELSENAIYSNLDKEGIIDDLNFKIVNIRKDHSPPLHILPGKCKFCYPEGIALKFIDPINEKLVIQIVIAQVDINEFRVEECKNNPILKINDELPF